MENLIDEILEKMFNKRGFDVRNYKMSNLQRRISRRMDVLGISSLVGYSEYLDDNPDEYEILFNTILVNVTRFFRDPEAWDFVRENVLPEILSQGDEVRIWSAGCASGEEAYSAAIMLAEILGDDIPKFTINIHATDIDETALKFARMGTYTIDQLSGMPEDLREKYFIQRGEVYTVVENIRDMLIFSRHNLVSDPPMSRIDLLICRNVLIYFDQVLQSRIIPKLQYALSETGYLWLGKAETMISDLYDLRPMNTNWHIYRRSQRSASPQIASIEYSDKVTVSDLIRANDRAKQIIQNIKSGLIMLDENFNVIVCNQAIEKIWGLLPDQILNKPFFNLEISYRPVDLRNRIEQAVASREASTVESAEYWITKDNRIYLKIEIIPVASGVIIFLENVTEQYELNKELRVTNKALVTANEKLVSRNKELEKSIEQLQYINEELQSTNEELEATSEERQATNEELNARIAKLNTMKEQYETLFNSIDQGIIVMDSNLCIRMWNTAAVSMWEDIDRDAVGRNLMSLNIGLPLKPLTDHLRQVLETGERVIDRFEFMDRWGRKAVVDLSINPLSNKDLEVAEVTDLVLVFRKVTDEALTTRQDRGEICYW